MFFRSLIFYFVFYSWTTFFFTLFSPVRFFKRKLTVSVSKIWSNSVMKLTKLILGIEFLVEGKDNIPKKGPYIVASNHQCAWETFFLYFYFDDPVFLLKKELIKTPILSGYFRKLGFIFIDRDKGYSSLKLVLKSVDKLIKSGINTFLIFPQGTRVNVFQKVNLNPGFYAIHKSLGIPIVPINHDAGKFWINKSFKKNSGVIKVKIFPPIKNLSNKKVVLKKLEKIFSSPT